MKLKTIIEGREAAARAMETVTSFDAGFALATLMEDTNVANSEYVKKQNALIEEYGKVPDPSKPEEAQYTGKFVSPTGENFPKFRVAMEELLDKEVDLSFKPLKQDYFKGEKIAGGLIGYLLPFFKKE